MKMALPMDVDGSAGAILHKSNGNEGRQKGKLKFTLFPFFKTVVKRENEGIFCPYEMGMVIAYYSKLLYFGISLFLG